VLAKQSTGQHYDHDFLMLLYLNWTMKLQFCSQPPNYMSTP